VHLGDVDVLRGDAGFLEGLGHGVLAGGSSSYLFSRLRERQVLDGVADAGDLDDLLLRRLRVLVVVSTTAAAPSVTSEQSCRRSGAAIIMFEPLPESGRPRIASAVCGTPFCTCASGFFAAFR
jgi:hypothetical protein